MYWISTSRERQKLTDDIVKQVILGAYNPPVISSILLRSVQEGLTYHSLWRFLANLDI